MPDFMLNSRSLPLARLMYRDRLNGFVEATVWPAEPCPAPEPGTPAQLRVGDIDYTLAVDDYDLRASGGWLKLVSPAARAARFDREVFSAPGGTTVRAVVESRTAVTGPPELSQVHATIVVDATLSRALDDLCARHAGWVWWASGDGVEVGPPTTTAAVDGHVVGAIRGGRLVTFADRPPRVGTTVHLPGVSGVLVTAAGEWAAGTIPLFSGLLGTAPTTAPARPNGLVKWPAVVKQLNPLVVELTDEDAPGRTFLARARLIGRESDGGKFREQIPIAVGDEVLAEVPTGGVSVLPVRVAPGRVAAPADKYRVASHSAEHDVAEDWTLSSNQVRETFNRGTSTVADRWDINKG